MESDADGHLALNTGLAMILFGWKRCGRCDSVHPHEWPEAAPGVECVRTMPPAYSEDAVAAVDLLPKLHERGFAITIMAIQKDCWSCFLSDDKRHIRNPAKQFKTMAFAIAAATADVLVKCAQKDASEGSAN